MAKYYCKECGKQVERGTPVCPYCGAALGNVMGQVNTQTTEMKPGDVSNRAQSVYALDNGSFAWICLGFLLPPLGLILYFLKRGDHPVQARAMLIGVITMLVAAAIVIIGGLVYSVIPASSSEIISQASSCLISL